MAVTRTGVGYTASYISGASTSGSIDTDFNVAAGENTYGVAVVGFVGDTDISTSATFTPTWNGNAMTSLLTAPLYFDEHSSHYHSMLDGWIIEDPAAGATTVAAAYASVVGGLITKNMFLAAAALSTVEPLDLDNITDAVVSAVGSGSVSSSGVTVASGVPADRVISAHLIGKLRAFSSFNGTRLAAPLLAGGGQLLLGESRGDTSVTATATHNAATANWAALGLNLDALPVDGAGFAGAITIPQASFGADLYRFALPHPDRYYVVPAAGADSDPTLILGATLRAANGVMMPVWTKDPDDTLEYTFSWNNHLAPDDEIAKVEHSSEGSLRIISEGINADDTAQTQFWTKGATRGVTHPVRIRWWTKRGRQQDFTAYIYGANN